MDDGFLLLGRKMFDGHDAFWPAPGSRPYTKAEAWIDLMQRARFAASENGRVPLKRGDQYGSIRTFARRWKWTVKRTRLFLEQCRNLGRLGAHARDQKKTHEGARAPTVYVIENYERYQTVPEQKGTRKGTRSGKKGEEVYLAEFEPLWRAWKGRPNNSKKLAQDKYIARRRQGISAEDLKAAVRRYYNYCKKEDTLGTSSMMQASTFFGPNERWKDEFAEGRKTQNDLPLLNK